MKIAIGADHAGYAMKNELVTRLRALGHDVEDVGTFSPESTDYPDYAAAVAGRVSTGEAERGVLVCSTGVGMSIAANKVQGIRAAMAMSDEEVVLSRTHNNINVLTLGASLTDQESANRWTEIFLREGFDGGRHERRVNKIAALEAKHGSTRP
ncbi:MAG: ribose 5-phosphate isomerase B [Bryobacterales bacterium]|nr:ribose 5-phosphate isomerase B [Bryobacterales bacterium]